MKKDENIYQESFTYFLIYYYLTILLQC